MNSEQGLHERRRELRYPFSLPVTLTHSNHPDEVIQGRVEDISLRGARISLRDPFPSETPVSIAYHVPYQQPAIVNTGSIKWASQEEGNHLTGIEMEHENNVRMTLKQVNRMISSSDEGRNDHPHFSGSASAERIIDFFSFEAYWGLLLWKFKDYLHTRLSTLACDLSIGSFYFEQLLDKINSDTDSIVELRQHRDILNKFETSIDNINKISTLFRHMQSEQLQYNQNSLTEFICLDSLLSDRIECFKKKLTALLIPYAGEITYFHEKSPEIIGTRTSICKGFDFLLLYSYQTLLYQGAKSLDIRLSFDQGQTCIDFINDGSQTLHQRIVEISPSAPFTFSGLHPKDKRHIAWLVFATSFFADLRARLLVINESGKNVVSLKIPTDLARAPQLQDSYH